MVLDASQQQDEADGVDEGDFSVMLRLNNESQPQGIKAAESARMWTYNEHLGGQRESCKILTKGGSAQSQVANFRKSFKVKPQRNGETATAEREDPTVDSLQLVWTKQDMRGDDKFFYDHKNVVSMAGLGGKGGSSSLESSKSKMPCSRPPKPVSKAKDCANRTVIAPPTSKPKLCMSMTQLEFMRQVQQ